MTARKSWLLLWIVRPNSLPNPPTVQAYRKAVAIVSVNEEKAVTLSENQEKTCENKKKSQSRRKNIHAHPGPSDITISSSPIIAFCHARPIWKSSSWKSSS